MQYTNDKFMPMQVENLISEQEKVLINPCPTFPIALESEVKLSLLPVYDNVIIRKD